MDLFHNNSGWLVLRGSCAVPVGPTEGFVLGRGGCLGQAGGGRLRECVCANMRVFGEQKAKVRATEREDMHDLLLSLWCVPPENRLM